MGHHVIYGHIRAVAAQLQTITESYYVTKAEPIGHHLDGIWGQQHELKVLSRWHTEILENKLAINTTKNSKAANKGNTHVEVLSTNPPPPKESELKSPRRWEKAIWRI